ncbi:MAG TPA: alpha/beta fold hydrolase [Polyangiaceae bacterium]|jgi:pimeloyl-ACP methyl ester carboxylesterase/putative sterol carrier protein|nr:alpha/beta fold hydrolase [Polyangiaceae bacterium]
MLRLERWLVEEPEGKPAEPSLRSALVETFAHFAHRKPPAAATSLKSAVVLDDGTGQPWTVRIERGRFSLEAGRARDAEATISSDPLTLASIVRGKKSGIEPYLYGRLHVRGNLSLVLKLDGVFDRREHPTDRLRAGRVSAAGIDTSYLEVGSGPPVIVLHGLAMTNASMISTVAALAKDHRVIAPDLPGFGDSAKPDGDYDPAFFARWLIAFMDAMGVERAFLVGNSMGGRIALETALVAPHRVEKLALFAASLAFRKNRQAVPLVRISIPEAAVVPLPLLGLHVRQALKLLFAKPARLHAGWYDAAVDEFLRIFKERRARVAFFKAARQIYLERPFGPQGFWQRLTTLSVPALFIWGERDRLVPPSFARHVEQAVPHAHSVLIEDCGHFPQIEHAELANRLVYDFFQQDDARMPRRVRA